MTHVKEEIIKIPEKFLDENGELKTQELLKSYLALEKKLSEPKTEEAQKPKSAMDYHIVCKNDLIESDPEINEILFQHGFSNDQARVVYDLASDKILPIIQNMVADIAADRELQGLEQAFGGAEQFNTIARQISAWAEKNIDAATFEALSKSKDGVLTLYQMMQGKMESPLIQGKGHMPVQDDEESLKKLIQSPKYWRDQDPELLKRVEAGFKRLYG